MTAALALANSARAGPPFVTDDPEPVEFKHWEVNYGVTKTWRSQSASVGLPSVDINYGVAPDVQLHVQPRYSIESTTTTKARGIDDTEIGVKYRFFNWEQGDTSVMLGIYPLFQIGTGDKTLGQDRGRGKTFLPLWIQRNSQKWTLYGGTGYRINPGAGNKNSVYAGATALYQMTGSLHLGAEVFHESPDAIDSKGTAGFNLGGIYNLGKDYNVLFSVGKGVTNVASTNQLSVYVALQVLR
ncbi:MAG: hypothetical protein JWR21_212 [Herminiimonas sp.]|nr:hypothetical protein [Herminiimonas sp.]MDB5856258.1 hypothetical protein [Herminiimonas sp.]